MEPTQPPVVQVVNRTGALYAALGVIVGLVLLGAVFTVGLGMGALTVFAGSSLEEAVIAETYRDGGRGKVTIIPVEGVIDPYRAESIRLMVDHALADRSCRAVVLRVDSPGGGIAPSDQIWYQVNRLRNAGLPVVASFGGVAASGGYYISCHVDQIVAEPTCITGSIGVIAQTFILTDLLGKVGIEPVTLISTESPQKDMGNPFRPWTEEDHARFTSMLDSAYRIFNQRVQDGRQDVIGDPVRIDELADGSVYTAQEALDNGLVDSIGYLDDAIAIAERSAGITLGRATVVVLREPPTLFGGMFDASASPPLRGLADPDAVRTLINDLGAPRVMYLMR